MARYIDVDILRKNEIARCHCVPCVGSNDNNYKDLDEVLNDCPTADVVSKSELDELKSAIKALERALDFYTMQYGTARDRSILLENAKRDVAVEICNEIEKHWSYLGQPGWAENLKATVDEIKRKYMEGQV